jgi:hypothetical protein
MSVHSEIKLVHAQQVTTCNLLEHSRHSWNVMDCSIVMNGSASSNLQLSYITCVVTACSASNNLQSSRTFQTQLECYRLFSCHEWQCKLQLATFIYHIVLSQLAMQVTTCNLLEHSRQSQNVPVYAMTFTPPYKKGIHQPQTHSSYFELEERRLQRPTRRFAS